MNDRDEQLLEHIKKHCDDIKKELEMINNSFEQFKQNKVVNKAIKMDILQIGENINNLSQATKNKLPSKDVRGIVDVRNFIAHGYVFVQEDAMWDTIQNDIPHLMNMLDDLLD